MRQLLLTTLALLYGTTGIISFIAFLPTIKDLWHGKSSANFHSYILWSACSAIAVLYGLLILHDMLFNVVMGLQLLACVIIVSLRLRLPK